MTDAQPIRYVRYLPGIRSAYIERFVGGPDAVTYFRYAEYLDPALLEPDRYRSAERREILRVARRADFDVLAIPEPFWIVEAPMTTRVALAARFGGWLRGRHVRIVTYAIENADPDRLLGLPTRLPGWIRRLGLTVFTLPLALTLDRIAFGTGGAAENYRAGLFAGPRGRIAKRSRVFPALSPACDCKVAGETEPIVLFLGPLATRKGLDRLLDAWPSVVAARPDARLVVAGTGSLQAELDAAIAADPSISQVVDAPRAEIHRLLRRARILVSLPRTERRWREQIGLSLPEGVSHGCHIVTTDQSGIADWLAAHGQTIVADDGVATVSAALIDALDAPTPVPDAELPDRSGRADAEWWMMAGGGRGGHV